MRHGSSVTQSHSWARVALAKSARAAAIGSGGVVAGFASSRKSVDEVRIVDRASLYMRSFLSGRVAGASPRRGRARVEQTPSVETTRAHGVSERDPERAAD